MLFNSNHPISCADHYIKSLRYVETLHNKYIVAGGIKRKVYHLLYVIYNEHLLRMGRKYNLDIGLHSCAEGLRIWHIAGGVVINKNARIGKNLILHGCNCIGNDGINSALAPKLGDNIHMGFGACVLGDVFIADGIWIAAGAVVVSSFEEPNIVIGGVPARKLKNL